MKKEYFVKDGTDVDLKIYARAGSLIDLIKKAMSCKSFDEAILNYEDVKIFFGLSSTEPSYVFVKELYGEDDEAQPIDMRAVQAAGKKLGYLKPDEALYDWWFTSEEDEG